ncbi:hypothetical protein CLV97_10856 [Planifilum fimeticola]|jgi:hypothetical protein|uniref:Uncharacterized protein n=1 Tax=Planifilum fimeticola TaxID=201975 RepID=A0A2T0LFV8_9BACL|nr:hypothetical protein [Planifilum fimeticola]PRX41126.1 hypothetical protein CLV97_10856 [Planifilum fimeticola]
MELLILIVAFVLWILQKALSSPNKEAAKKRKKRPPAPTPWRDPWGERTDTIPFPDLSEEDALGEPVRPPSPSATGSVKEIIQNLPEEIRDAAEQVKTDVQGAISEAEKRVETLKEVQPPIPSLKRKKTIGLEKGLFTKNSLVRGIILQEVLGPPPSRRYWQRTHRRAP